MPLLKNLKSERTVADFLSSTFNHSRAWRLLVPFAHRYHQYIWDPASTRDQIPFPFHPALFDVSKSVYLCVGSARWRLVKIIIVLWIKGLCQLDFAHFRHICVNGRTNYCFSYSSCNHFHTGHPQLKLTSPPAHGFSKYFKWRMTFCLFYSVKRFETRFDDLIWRTKIYMTKRGLSWHDL